MSEQLSFDRKKGFVALPVEIMDFDLTPGAFRTLAELCRMANAEGFCWPSLHQLSERLGRSRSAISGYIKELRTADLVDTEEQKTANGYNYRLKYRVTFWQAWRASLKGAAVQTDERSVQPIERRKDSKKHIHINHQPEGISVSLEKTLKEWSRCFAGAPYPQTRHAPRPSLVMETRRLLSTPGSAALATKDQISLALTQLWRCLNVTADAKQITEHAQVLQALQYSKTELDQAIKLLQHDWPAHWRKCPQPDGLLKRIKSAGLPSQSRQMAVLQRHYKRWQLAEKTLQNRSGSCSVAS